MDGGKGQDHPNGFGVIAESFELLPMKKSKHLPPPIQMHRNACRTAVSRAGGGGTSIWDIANLTTFSFFFWGIW